MSQIVLLNNLKKIGGLSGDELPGVYRRTWFSGGQCHFLNIVPGTVY